MAYTFEISFDTRGGTELEDITISAENENDEISFTLPSVDDVTKDGCELLYWWRSRFEQLYYPSDDIYVFSDEPNEFTAYYNLVFNFDLDGGTSSSIYANTKLRIEEFALNGIDEIVVAKLPIINPTREGYNFLYWQAEEDSSIQLTDGADISELTRGYTLKAVWESSVIYIDNRNTFEPYHVYIDNGSSWDLYVPYVDNGIDWNAIG